MLVTGGSSGIGLEIARQFGTKSEEEINKTKCHANEILKLNLNETLFPSSGLHGASVFVTGRRQAVLDAAVADLRSCGVAHAAGIQGDVRKPEDVERWVSVATTTAAGPSAAAAEGGALDVLVNCAAGNFLAAADALSANGFRTVLDIDAVGTFSASRAAFPALKRAAERSSSPSSSPSTPSSPVVINISATLHYGATWWQAHACAAKAAVDALTRSLALEWGEFGVRVCGVAPGPIAGTAGLSKLSGSGSGGGKDNDLAAAIASLVPLGRLGSAWDIAMACVWLSSAGSRFTSGDTLVVDGAAWLWRPPAVPRAVVAEVSRKVEAGSRAMTKATSSAGAGGASRL